MRTIYSKYFEDDKIGEAEAFYDIVDGKLHMITCWSCYDASYRGEYMDSLFSYLGVTIEDLPEKYVKKATSLIRKQWGL